MAVKFGCCIPGASFMPEAPDNKPYSPFDVLLWGEKEIINSGYDFAECSVGLIMNISDEDFEKVIEKNVKIKICNCFIPSEYKIVEDSPELWERVEKSLWRMEKLSTEIVVLGSGGARSIPDTMPYEEGFRKVEKFLIRCNELTKKHNIIIAIEPLNHNESNFIPTVNEAYKLAKKLNLSNVRILADIFHMYVEKEAFSVLNDTVDEIIHTHINNPLTRTCPTLEENKYIINFAKALNTAGYNKTVTIESSFDDFSNEIKDAIVYLRKVFDNDNHG